MWGTGSQDFGSKVASTMGSVICTELYRQGFISQKLHAVESAYGKTLPTECMTGYHSWARPVVDKMKRSRLFTRVIHIITKPILQEMAHRVDKTYHSSFIGSVVLFIGEPLCCAMGCLKNDMEVASNG
jgi:hypothetical protein